MKKQPERTAMTRHILIDTFLELSESKPIDKITVSEIANKAGYNRSTFYQYFDDTQHLLSSIEDDLLLYIKKMVITQIGKVRPEQFFVDGFIRIHAEKGKVLKVLFSQNGNTAFPVKLKESLIPAFAAQMKMDLQNPQSVFLLDFYLSGIISIISRWVTSDPALPPEEYALLMHNIVEGMGKSGLFPVL